MTTVSMNRRTHLVFQKKFAGQNVVLSPAIAPDCNDFVPMLCSSGHVGIGLGWDGVRSVIVIKYGSLVEQPVISPR